MLIGVLLMSSFSFAILQGTLEAKENVIDSKREVDNQLKKSCENFIDNVANELFGPVTDLIKKVSDLGSSFFCNRSGLRRYNFFNVSVKRSIPS